MSASSEVTIRLAEPRAFARNRLELLVRMASRNLWRSRRRTLAAMAAVLLGVFATVLLKGFFNGFIDAYQRGLVEAQTGAIQIHRAGYLDAHELLPLDLDFALTPELLAEVRSVPGVTAVSPRIAFGAMVTNGRTSTNALVVAVDPRQEPKVTPRAKDELVAGQPLSGDDAAGLFSVELAESMGASPGAVLTLSTADRHGGMAAADLTVRGHTYSAVPYANKRVVRMPFLRAQQLLKMEGRATELAVNVASLEQAQAVAGALQKALGPTFEVSPWQRTQPFVHAAIQREGVIVDIAMVVLAIIVITIIANTMLLNVTERVREIGTMMAVGAKRRLVAQLFLSEAALLGLFAGALGALAGYVAVALIGAHGVHFKPPDSRVVITFVPAIRPAFLLLADLGALAAAVLAALYPAIRAARLPPVEALRSL